jgi:hypothetical protein
MKNHTRPRAGLILALALLLSVVLPVAADEPPRLPSGFYGTVKQLGANVPNGTAVSAWINGVKYAETTAFLTSLGGQQVSVYTITVPGDDPSTSGVIEGGNNNDTIAFRIGSNLAYETGTWHEGTDVERNLTVNFAPATVSVTPSGGNAMPNFYRAFVATYEDPNGWQDLRDVYLMWNTSPVDSAQQLRYEVSTRKIYLRNDANTEWIGGFAAGTDVRLTNMSLSVDVATTTVVTTSTQIRVTWNLLPKQPTTSVNWTAYLKSTDSGSQSTGWVNRGVWRINMFPNVGGLSPASGGAPAGTPQVFTTTYSDEDGTGTINWVFLRATMQSSPNTEHLRAYYNRTNNKLYLLKDGAWAGGLTPGVPGTVETPYAILDAGASAVTETAKVLTVNWSITFKSGTEGAKDIWGYIYDNQSFQDGYVLLGHWTVGSGSAASVPQGAPPEAEAPVPLDAPEGFEPIYRTPEMDPDSPLSGMVSPDTLRAGRADPSVPSLDLRVMRQANPMPKSLATNQPAPSGMPVAGNYSPTQGNKAPGWGWSFRAQISDPSGYAHISQVYMLFSMTGSTQNAIYVRYDQNTNRIYLRDSDDTTWIGGYTPGTNVKISNKNGTLDVAQSWTNTYGDYLDVFAYVIFKALGQSQHYRLFVAATDDAGNTLDWVEKGWHRVNMWGSNGGLTPSTNTQVVGSTHAYVTTYTDLDGASDLKYVFFNIASTAGATNQSVLAVYNLLTGRMQIRTDSGAWSAGIVPGQPQNVENSWGILHGQGCSVVMDGDRLTVTWSIEFKATLAGTTKNVYLYAQDKLDWVSDWSYAGKIEITP